MVDPRSPVGGANLIGVPNPDAPTFQKNLYVEINKIDTLGGCLQGAPPGSATDIESINLCITSA